MAKEYVSSALEFDWVHSLEHNVAPIALESIVFGSFFSKLYVHWLADWKDTLAQRIAQL